MANTPITSRRDFLATSALGIVGLATRPDVRPAAGVPQADEELLYVGTYTDRDRAQGIHLVRFDTRSGDLVLLRSVDVGPNPSFLAIHPNGRTLYAVNEVDEVRQANSKSTGDVAAFAIAPETGDLTRINSQSSQGGAPCYVSVDRQGRVALVANYMGGNVVVLPIGADGALAPVKAFAIHSGRGPNVERQEAAHAHCVVADPTNRFALIADLGLDRVFLYRLDAERGTLRTVEDGHAAARPGAGPRHLAFHPRLPLVYVANELDSTVTTLRLDADRATLTTLAARSTLPDGWTGANSVADVHVAPDGRTLYVSNRGHNSVAVFSVADSSGELTREQVVSTEGDWPRNFSLDPTGRWLLVANQRSGTIVVFRREEATGRLSPAGKQLAVAAPVCLRFRAHTSVTT